MFKFEDMSEVAIYILKKSKLLKGPYTLDILKDKGIRSTDMVWFKGLEDWTEAKNVQILDSIIDWDAQDSERDKGFFSRLFGRVR